MQVVPSPSSSTTTPSPSMSFRQPSEAPDSTHVTDLDPQEREERQRAIKKFLARAEFSKVNILLFFSVFFAPRGGRRDGERCRRARRVDLTRGLRARLAYASFKATHNLSHATLPDLEERIYEPTPSPAPSPSPAPVPPQSPFSSPHKRRPAMPPPASPSRSLYSSLLGPPTKRARHVYGPGLGPGPSPSDLLPSYTPATPRSRATASPRRTPHGQSPFPNNGQGRTVRTVMEGRARSTVTEKEDINAAATLTALMFNRGSPRTRPEEGTRRTATPAPPQESKSTEDADAAELMLYLATSPSPVRPTVVRRPPSTSMGRVLFPGATSANEKDDAADRPGTPGLTNSQSSSQASSQESSASQLLPPPPSPSRSQARSPKAALNARKSPNPLPRKLFADSEEARRISELRDGGGGGGSPRFSLGKGIDLVEAK
ncbi:hypothetical protein M422DRAFT_43271 [Sphaerobolus stellatus SS14]|nr:hypothetical protein M422DRAFT_43271 [Sphaerobolus stellatus SS14]